MRRNKADRLQDIAEAAYGAFSAKGFRLTQVADIAQRAGVAPGTIYLFAKSKEDLFWLALRFALKQPLNPESELAMSAEAIRSSISSSGGNLSIRQSLNEGKLPAFEEVIRDHWGAVSGAAHAIKLIERCAQDWPDLASAFYGDLRVTVVKDLTDYLIAAGEKNICRKTERPDVAARLIIETIAWFAMHRLGDADGYLISDEAARESTVDALLHAFGPEFRSGNNS